MRFPNDIPPIPLEAAKNYDGGFTEAGAHRLARNIKAAWARVGHHNVEAWVELVPRKKELYQVRTNLVNGYPAPYRLAKKEKEAA